MTVNVSDTTNTYKNAKGFLRNQTSRINQNLLKVVNPKALFCFTANFIYRK